MDLRRKTAMPNVVPLQRGAGAGSTLSIPVEGMTCASCVSHVEKAIAKLPDVTKVSDNLATERAEIAFTGKPDAAAVVRAVEGAGYGMSEVTVELVRSEEHTSELQSLMCNSYAVFCLKKKNITSDCLDLRQQQ